MRSPLLFSVFAASMLAPVSAGCAADLVLPPQLDSEWYLAVFGGLSFGGSLDIDAQSALEPETGVMAGMALGTGVSEHLLGEIELSGIWGKLGNEADGDSAATFLLANLWLDVPLGPVGLVAGGGIGIGHLSVDLDDGSGSGDEAGSGFAYQFGAGLGFELAPTVDFDVGYEFKTIHNALDGKDFHSHNVLIGLTFRFEND